MKKLFFKKSRKAITALILALTICIGMATPAFAATQEIKVGTNSYQYNTHYDNGLKPCFATDGYCMISVWSGINAPISLTPSDIPETIEGYPVVCMRTAYESYSTDANSSSIDHAPEIPKYMQDMELAFVRSKIPAPPSKIPDMVVNLKGAFAQCVRMQSFPVLGSAIENMESSFNGCTSAVGKVALPDTVKYLSYAFQKCKNLSEIPDLSKLTDLQKANGAFWDCSSAIGGTDLPSGTYTDISYMFMNCSKMTKAPSVIPQNVTFIGSTFDGCQSLTGTIDVRANISSANAGQYADAFAGAATAPGAELILNYTAENESAIDDIIAKKIITSNIKKGVLLGDELPPTPDPEPMPDPDPNPDEGDGMPVPDGSASQDVVIRGVVEPINSIDVDIPLNLTFTINENRNIFYTKNAKITSNSPAPLVVSSLGVTVPANAPKLVADNTFPDWNRLTMAQTKNNLAVSINGVNLCTANVKLGDIDSGYGAPAELPLTLSVLYGKLWPNTSLLTFDYIMNLEIALAE